MKGHVSVRPQGFIHKEKVKASFTKCRALWGIKGFEQNDKRKQLGRSKLEVIFLFFLFFGILGFAGTSITTAFGSDILPWKRTDL